MHSNAEVDSKPLFIPKHKDIGGIKDWLYILTKLRKLGFKGYIKGIEKDTYTGTLSTKVFQTEDQAGRVYLVLNWREYVCNVMRAMLMG